MAERLPTELDALLNQLESALLRVGSQRERYIRAAADGRTTEECQLQEAERNHAQERLQTLRSTIAKHIRVASTADDLSAFDVPGGEL